MTAELQGDSLTCPRKTSKALVVSRKTMARRNKSVTIKLSEEEANHLKALAKEKDLPMSIVLRQMLRQEQDAPTHVIAEIVPPKRQS